MQVQVLYKSSSRVTIVTLSGLQLALCLLRSSTQLKIRDPTVQKPEKSCWARPTSPTCIMLHASRSWRFHISLSNLKLAPIFTHLSRSTYVTMSTNPKNPKFCYHFWREPYSSTTRCSWCLSPTAAPLTLLEHFSTLDLRNSPSLLRLHTTSNVICTACFYTPCLHYSRSSHLGHQPFHLPNLVIVFFS